MTEEFNQACRLQLSDVKNKMWVIFSYQHYQCRQNKFHEAVTSLMPDLPAQQKVSDDSHIANHTFWGTTQQQLARVAIHLEDAIRSGSIKQYLNS